MNDLERALGAKKPFSHRVMLISDIHYTTEQTESELKKIHPGAKASAAAGTVFGFTQEQKIEIVRKTVRDVCENTPLDAVMVLGDLSIDDYPYRNLPENYCERFRDRCMNDFPCQTFALAGNHDSYPDEMWREMFGDGRQFARVIGGCLFVFLDTYRDTLAKGASGSGCTPADTGFLAKTLAEHPGMRTFLLAHHFSPENESEAFARILDENRNILALFRGHTHRHELLNPPQFGYIPLADIGGFGYNGMAFGGAYTFQIFDRAWGWGYELIEWNDEETVIRHVRIPLTYQGANGTVRVEESVSGLVYFEGGKRK